MKANRYNFSAEQKLYEFNFASKLITTRIKGNVHHILFYLRYSYNPYVSRRPLNNLKYLAVEVSSLWTNSYSLSKSTHFYRARRILTSNKQVNELSLNRIYTKRDNCITFKDHESLFTSGVATHFEIFFISINQIHCTEN